MCQRREYQKRQFEDVAVYKRLQSSQQFEKSGYTKMNAILYIIDRWNTVVYCLIHNGLVFRCVEII